MKNQTIRLDQEDFFYQETAVPVIDDIMGFLKTLKKPGRKSFQYAWDYPIDPDVWFDLWEDDGFAFYSINVNVSAVDYDSDHPGWNIDGEAGFSESAEARIDVDIQLAPEYFGNSNALEKLESELYNVVPHEIHHLTQNDQPFQRISCPLTTSSTAPGAGYFMSSCEVPAFVIGFRGEAHKSGRPIEELMDVYLGNQVRARKISTQDAEKIKRTWLAHTSWRRGSMSESIIREYVRHVLLEKKIAIGLCYPHAINMAMNAPVTDKNDLSKFKVVHGRVTDKWNGESNQHAWVEIGDMIFDWQSHVTKPDGISRDVYYDMFQPEIYEEYTAAEAIMKCVESEHAGPWRDQ